MEAPLTFVAHLFKQCKHRCRHQGRSIEMNINANSNMSESVLVDITETIQREDGGGGGKAPERKVIGGPAKGNKKAAGRWG